jgi:hypothetical protein
MASTQHDGRRGFWAIKIPVSERDFAGLVIGFLREELMRSSSHFITIQRQAGKDAKGPWRQASRLP